jgi:hypothetical protein
LHLDNGTTRQSTFDNHKNSSHRARIRLNGSFAGKMPIKLNMETYSKEKIGFLPEHQQASIYFTAFVKNYCIIKKPFSWH